MSTEKLRSIPDNVEQRPYIDVQVCLLTYRRAELLKLALESLLAQTVLTSRVLFNDGDECYFTDVNLHILLVDNDSNRTARPVFEQVSASTTTQMRYICEPSRGLSTARNRALIESEHMDYIAFLDDDEAAQPDWLSRLLNASATYNADVVTGPVEPRYIDSPEWVVRGRFFNPASCPTGKRIRCAATNNVLLRGSIASAFRFDSRFDTTGGEDTEFFMRIERAGHCMIWVEEARVSECVPETRANVRWLLSRAHSDANRYTRSCLSFDSGIKTVSLRAITACGGFLAGLILLPRSLFGRHHAIRALQLMSRSIGTMSALRGRNQVYYEAIHG